MKLLGNKLNAQVCLSAGNLKKKLFQIFFAIFCFVEKNFIKI